MTNGYLVIPGPFLGMTYEPSQINDVRMNSFSMSPAHA